MKLYAPEYYKNFKCIADKCNHSCCIGWEIDIDPITLSNYNSLSCVYGNIIQESIDYRETPHFRLEKNNKCPHLNEKGLCNIILNIGEDLLCDICREHPRFYNFTNHGKEVGIGMSCEAACDLILKSDNFDKMIEIDEICGEITHCEYDSLNDRNKVYQILKDKDVKIDIKIEKLYEYFDVNLYEYYFPNIISKLEYLDESHKELFSKAETLNWNNELSDELTRILAYFVYRHCSEAMDYYDFYTSLSFSIFCTGLISTIAQKNNIHEIARIVSEEIEYSEENVENIKSSFYIDKDDYLSI